MGSINHLKQLLIWHDRVQLATKEEKFRRMANREWESQRFSKTFGKNIKVSFKNFSKSLLCYRIEV